MFGSVTHKSYVYLMDDRLNIVNGKALYICSGKLFMQFTFLFIYNCDVENVYMSRPPQMKAQIMYTMN